MTTDAHVFPQSLFWTLEGGLSLALVLLLWATQAMRRWPGSPTWRLFLATGLVIALGLLIAACQLGTVAPRLFEPSALFNLALLGVVLAGGLNLLVSSLCRPRQPPTIRPPTPPLSQQQRSRREDRRWRP